MTTTETDLDRSTPPTHAQGYDLFLRVVTALRSAGWRQLRVDTLVWGDADDREAKTVRHHYDHGVWEFHFEADRYWRPLAKPLRTARIKLSGPLPTVRMVLSDLFGPDFTVYAQVPRG